MTVEHTNLEGCYVISPKIIKDSRGYFFERFNAQTFQKLTGKSVNFVQDNQSFSKKGVIRGLHYQEGAFAQAKLVSVIQGAVLDVCVDLRVASKTFGKHFSIRIDDNNKKQLFVPKGFAHGFSVLSEQAIFSYKCDCYYNKASERGIIYNDPSLGINWQTPESERIISEKDLQLPTFQTVFT